MKTKPFKKELAYKCWCPISPIHNSICLLSKLCASNGLSKQIIDIYNDIIALEVFPCSLSLSLSPSPLHNVFSTFLIERCVSHRVGHIHQVERAVYIHFLFNLYFSNIFTSSWIVYMQTMATPGDSYIYRTCCILYKKKPAMQLASSRSFSLKIHRAKLWAMTWHLFYNFHLQL